MNLAALLSLSQFLLRHQEISITVLACYLLAHLGSFLHLPTAHSCYCILSIILHHKKNDSYHKDPNSDKEYKACSPQRIPNRNPVHFMLNQW